MDIVEKLIVAHSEVRERRDILAKLVTLINSDMFFWDNAVTVVHFFRTEVREHFAIEEKALFPILRKVATGEDARLLAEIEAQHAPILRLVEQVERSAEQHTRYPSKSTREHFVKVCEEALTLLIPHANREDEVIFPMIRRLFGDAHYRELEEAYVRYLEER